MQRLGVIAIGFGLGMAACGSSGGGKPPDGGGPPDGFACTPRPAPSQHQALIFTGYIPTTFELVDLNGGTDGALTPVGQLNAQSDRGFEGLTWSPDGSRASAYDEDQWLFSFRDGETPVAPLVTASAWSDSVDRGSSPFSPSGCLIVERTFDGKLERLDDLASGGLAPPLTVASGVIYTQWAPGADRIAYVRGTGTSQDIGVMDEHGSIQEWPISSWNFGLWWVGSRWILAQLGDAATPSGLIAIDTSKQGSAPIAITPSSAHVRFVGASPSNDVFVVTDLDTNVDTIVNLSAAAPTELRSAHHLTQGASAPEFLDAQAIVAPSTKGAGLAAISVLDDSEAPLTSSLPELWRVPHLGTLWTFASGAWSYLDAQGAAVTTPCTTDPRVSHDGHWYVCDSAQGVYVSSVGSGPHGAFAIDGDSSPGSFRATFSPDDSFVEYDRYATPHFFDLKAWNVYVPPGVTTATQVSWRPFAAP